MEVQAQKYNEACSHLRDALTIREKLAAENPAAFDLDLCQTILSMNYLYISAPEPAACILKETDILSLLYRSIEILKKYPQIPQAQDMLKIAEISTITWLKNKKDK